MIWSEGLRIYWLRKNYDRLFYAWAGRDCFELAGLCDN